MKMKSKILSIIASAAMLVSVASCDNYEPKIVGGGEGKLDTSSLSVEVSNAEKIVNEGSATKKGLSRAVTDLSDYLVIVTDAQGNEVKRWTYATMPELPTFPAGTYNINVLSREEPTSAEWDAPFFKGSTSFTIVADEVTDNVKVVCKLANIRVTVKFTDELVAASAGDIKVTVRSEGEQNLTFTPSETRSGYFAAVDGLETFPGYGSEHRGEVYQGSYRSGRRSASYHHLRPQVQPQRTACRNRRHSTRRRGYQRIDRR